MTRERRVRISEAAELLGCSTRLVQKLCITGELPASKVGSIWTIAPSAIDAYLERRQQPSPKAPRLNDEIARRYASMMEGCRVAGRSGASGGSKARKAKP